MNRNTLLKSIITLVLLVLLPSMATAATETIIWIHTDHLGSPITGRNAAGETTWEQAYAPWGEKQAVAGVPETPAGVSYTGHVYDEQVGLIYAGARWYDPKVGRFLSPDSVRFAADDTTSFNRYAYVGNDPLSWIDPDGNMKRDMTGNRSGDSAKILEGGGIFVPQGSYRAFTPSASRTPAIRGKGAVSEAPGAIPPTGLIPRSGPTTSNAARREAMRQAGIPTSQQPVSQSRNASGREYTYEVPTSNGVRKMSVQQQTLDSSHKGQPHWEAGHIKIDPLTGSVRFNNFGRPSLTNDKVKVNY